MADIYFHLPGLFEFYELYKVFLLLFYSHREYFYDNCGIGSVYGAPADCLWGGGRVGFGDAAPADVAALMAEYGISARLTFSNSLLKDEHLDDRKCNRLCALFEKNKTVENGVILTIEGYDTPEKANTLRGKYLCVDREHTIKLPKYTYFVADLIGCEVFDTDGICYGKLTDVLETGANDVYEIEKGKLMVPALKKLISEVDTEQKRIVFHAEVLKEVGLFEN